MLTLLEFAKLCNDPLQRGVVETFARTSPILERIPFQNIQGSALVFNREQTLPAVGFRAINADYTEDTGELDRQTEVLAVLGGCSDVDSALVKMQGDINSVRAVHDNLLAKSISLAWTKYFLKGDSLSDPKAFDGLQGRCTGAQILDQGSTASGATLTLAKIDELVDQVDGDSKVLLMNKTLKRKMNSLIREVGSAYEIVSDNFGRQLMSYGGTPVLVIGEDESGSEILDFTEACASGSSVGSSIYCVNLAIGDGCFGIQNAPAEVIDHGRYAGGVKFRTTIEWLTSICLGKVKAAARLRYIKNA